MYKYLLISLTIQYLKADTVPLHDFVVVPMLYENLLLFLAVVIRLVVEESFSRFLL